MVQTFRICFTLFLHNDALTTDSCYNNYELCISPYRLFMSIPIILTLDTII